MNQEPEHKPSIAEKIESIQYSLASIIGSTIIVEWVATWDVVRGLFLPDNIWLLEGLRRWIAVFGLIAGCFVGIKAILWVASKAVEVKQNYTDLMELKKNKDREK